MPVNGTDRQTDWNAVAWRQAHRHVRNLRQRIFRATREGDFNKVRSLQKLMLRSYSNRLTSVRRVAQTNVGSRTAGVDKVLCKTAKSRGITRTRVPGGRTIFLHALEGQTSTTCVYPQSKR